MFTADVIIYKDGKPIHTVRDLGPCEYRFDMESEIRHVARLFESCDLEHDDDVFECSCGDVGCDECGYCKDCGCICETFD